MSKSILNSVAIYIGGEIINKAIPFLLLPFLTAFLSPNDFGIVATYQAVLQVLLVIISLSMHGAISVLFFKVEQPFFKKVLASIFILSCLLAALVALIIAVFHKNIVQFLGVELFWVLALPIIVLFQAFIQFLLVFYQVRKQQNQYVTLQLASTLVNVSVSIALIAYWNIGLEGRIAGIAIAAVIFGLWALFNFKKNNNFDFNVNCESFLMPLRFSLPLVPHSLSNWIKTSIDRLLLMSFFGAAVVGEYAVMYQLASILSVVFMAVNKALVPFLFSYLKNGEYDKSQISFWCKKIAFIIIALSIGFLLLIPFIFNFIINSEYHFNYLLISLLIIGFMFQGLYLLLVNFFMFYEKTKVLAKIAIINTLLHLFLAIPLVYFYGALGGALTNAISWFLLLVLIYSFGTRKNVYPWISRV